MRLSGLSPALLLAALSASAVAETHFCIGGDLDRMSAAEVSTCRTKMVDLRDAVKRHGAPSGWHFVVVCDENGWKDYASFAGQERAKTVNAAFTTDSQLHWTFVRGSRMDANAPEEADLVLASALKNVPARHVVPAPLANPGRTPAQTDLEIAAVNQPRSGDGYGQ